MSKFVSIATIAEMAGVTHHRAVELKRTDSSFPEAAGKSGCKILYLRSDVEQWLVSRGSRCEIDNALAVFFVSGMSDKAVAIAKNARPATLDIHL